jgi:hypothetical protein
MKRKKGPLCLLLVLLAGTALFSCKTVKPERADSEGGFMYAMIYDFENTPVSGADVFIDNKKYTESDINGRFIMEFVKPGHYTIRVTKTGYESMEQEFKYDPMNVIYLKMINAPQLLDRAENAMDRHDYLEAEAMIDRALTIEQYRPDALFLKSISLYLRREYEAARAVLEILSNRGYNDASIRKLESLLNGADN